MMIHENYTKTQVKTKNRFALVSETLDVLKQFFELGYRAKQDVYTQLCVAFPKYDTKYYRYKFAQVWNFNKYDAEMLRDLNIILNNINSK